MKGYTVRAFVPHVTVDGGKGITVHTMGMDGNFYLTISAWSSVKPATFDSKADASDFYYSKRNQCLVEEAFIEGPKGGHHHIIQWR